MVLDKPTRPKVYGLIVLIAFFILTLSIRLWIITQVPALDDELELIKEASRIHLSYLPVQFVGFGWGENVTLAYLALPLIRWCKVQPLIAIRMIVLLAQVCGWWLLSILLARWVNRTVACIAVINSLIWPWSVMASSIGFNAFLAPALCLGTLVLLEQHRAHPKDWQIICVGILCALMLYTYGASVLWVPLMLLGYWWSFRKQISIRSVFGIIGCAALLAVPIVLVYVQSQEHILLLSHMGALVMPQLTKSRFDYLSVFTLYHTMHERIGYYLLNYFLHFITLFLTYNPAAAVSSAQAFLGLSFTPFAYLFQSHPGTLSPGVWLNNTTLAYPWDVLFVLIGIIMLRQYVGDTGVRRFLYFWVFAWPLGPSFIHADYIGYTITRDIFGLPILMTLSAIGCYATYQGFAALLVKKKALKASSQGLAARFM